MLTMRNHKLNVFYCIILRRKKPGDYTENGKESPRNYHETKQSYSMGGDNTKRCSTLLQQTKFHSLHLLREVCEHWPAISSDGGVTVITWIDKSLIQQLADLEGANGNTTHWGKGVTPPYSSCSFSINLHSLWNRIQECFCTVLSKTGTDPSIRGCCLPYFIVKNSVIFEAKSEGFIT